MNIPVDDKALQAVVQQAIFQSITPESRDGLVRQAIENLLKVDTGSYDKQSALQRAFGLAVESIAYKIVKEQLEADTVIKEKVEIMIRAALDKVMTDNEELVTNLAKVIARAFEVKDRY